VKGIFQNQDTLEIDDILYQYSKQILNLVYTYVKDWGIAEDLTQEIFLKVSARLATFEQRSSFKTWLYRIAINHCKDFKRKRYFTSTVVTAKIQDLFKSREPSAENRAVMRSQNKELAEKIMGLPIKYRETIILYYYEDLSILEICDLLKMKESTIKSRLQRGRSQLAMLLDGSDFE
jgi:RNA polymerase sigma-70 factor, ECF subfamily